MPKVRSLSGKSAANCSAAWTARRNSCSGSMTWSAGMTMIVASGSFRAMSAAPRPTHAAVSRPIGSPIDLLRRHHSAQLLGGFRAVLRAGDHPRPFGRNLGRDAVHGALEERAIAAEAEELLRPDLPAARPEPRPAAAGHDHRVEHEVGSAGVTVGVWVRRP